MDHVAIDLGGRKSQVCIRSAEGTLLKEQVVLTRQLPQFFSQLAPSRIVIEACAEAFFVADAAKEYQHDVRVVPSTLAPQLGVGARKTKTDRRDARALSEVSCRIELPSVHVPSRESRHRKSVCGMRDNLVSSRTLLINSVRGWLRGIAVRPRAGASKTFPARVRELVGGDLPELPAHVERQLRAIEALTEQIREADKEVRRFADADDVCKRLKSIPGVGSLTAVRFVAAVDRVDRFASAHKVQAYLGLTPGENSSSARVQRTGITKAGAPAVRHVLVQAAWTTWRRAPDDPIVVTAKEIAARRGRAIAITALARRLVGVMFALWRDGVFYDASHGRRVPLAA